ADQKRTRINQDIYFHKTGKNADNADLLFGTNSFSRPVGLNRAICFVCYPAMPDPFFDDFQGECVPGFAISIGTLFFLFILIFFFRLFTGPLE
ncbi:MAG TPA: hypothetical protein VFC34_10855, partial [Puia sp.]|nr:hypothetical protein [Puia sp.]